VIDLKLFNKPLAAVSVTGEKGRVTRGLLALLAGALSESNVNVYNVSSGEYTITFYVDEEQHKVAKDVLGGIVDGKTELASLSVMRNLAMITGTGPEFIDRPGMFAGFTGPVAKAGINVFSVTASFDSVVLFVDWNDAKAAYNAIERSFLSSLRSP